jgi:hypothetical protein
VIVFRPALQSRLVEEVGMLSVLTQFFSGLTTAMFLFLLASGLSLIFGVSRVINVSHGAFYMLGAYLMVTVSKMASVDLVGFALLAVFGSIGVGLLGGVVEWLILRRVYKGGMLFVALVTFGILAVMEEVAKIIWGAELTTVSRPSLLDGSAILFGGSLPRYDLVLIGAGLVLALGIWAIVEKTRFGLLIRAASVDREMLAALGVDVPRVFTITFAFGAGLAGLAGILAAPMVSISPTMGSSIIIEAFAVVVIGGLGSLPGSLLGAFIVGEALAFGILLIPGLALVMVYLLMAIILILRPEGLLGSKS